MSDDQRTVAIIGGGIAGLYCAYHLKNGPFRTTLYEASDRLGGKIETWRIDPETLTDRPTSAGKALLSTLIDDYDAHRKRKPGDRIKPLPELLIAEFGAMRIEPDQQPHLNKLLSALGIKEHVTGSQELWSDLVPFPAYEGAQPTEPHFTLEGEEAEQGTLIDLLLLALRRVFTVVTFDAGSERNKIDKAAPWTVPGQKNTPYAEANFFWGEFKEGDFLHRRFWKRSLTQWIKLMEEEHYQVIRNAMMFQGTHLRDMGFWNLLELSAELHGDRQDTRLGQLLPFTFRESERCRMDDILASRDQEHGPAARYPWRDGLDVTSPLQMQT